MALPVDKIRIYYRWIHIYLWPAWVRQGLPHVLQSENPRSRTYEGEALWMRGQRVRQKLQHSLQVRVAGIDFLFYIFLFKNEAGKGMVDPENLLDLWTRGDWQFVLRDIFFRERGVGFEVYIYINILGTFLIRELDRPILRLSTFLKNYQVHVCLENLFLIYGNFTQNK